MEASPLSSGQRALRDAEVTVSKIGGESATQLRANAATILARMAEGKKQVYMISALRSGDPAFEQRYAHPMVTDRDANGKKKTGFNTTSHLIALARCLCEDKESEALDLLERIRAFTKEIVRSELVQDDDLPDRQHAITELNAVIDRLLDAASLRLRSTIVKPAPAEEDWIIKDEGGAFSITGIGEELAEAIYLKYFQLKNMSVGDLQTEGFMQLIRGLHPQKLIEEEQMRTVIDHMRTSVAGRIRGLLRMHGVVVAGGYLPVLASRRNYSDISAALIAQAVREAGMNVLYVKEGDTPVRSANPKDVPSARVIHEMTPEFAMEAFGDQRGASGGAIHAEAIRMLAESGVDAVVYDPKEDPSLNRITHIHQYDPSPGNIEMVASRSVPIAVEIQSIRMLGQPGFIHTISGWFAERGISIDQGGGTSEVTITFTFANGNAAKFDPEELRQFLGQTYGPDPELKLDVKEGKSMIFCLGNNMTQPGALLDAAVALNQVQADIHFFAKGLNARVMSFIIDADKAPAALRRLHEVCIERSGK